MDSNIVPVLANESTAARRRVYFFIRLIADGVSPASKATGQPQISVNGAAWTNTGIATLTEVGTNTGEHYADVTQATVVTAGDRIRTRFKDDDTIETRGDTLLVVAYNPFSATTLGLSALSNQRPQKNTALPSFEFVMLLTGTNNGAIGKTVAATRSIDGGAMTACANSPTEVASGIYKIDLAASDLNGNCITFRFSATGCDNTIVTIMTQG